MTNHLERLALERRLRVGERTRLVLRILDRARTPLSVQDIYLRARSSSLSLGLPTIRRILNQLVAAALLRRLDLPGNKRKYEKVHREQRESLIDRSSGQRIEFHSEGIEGLLKHAVQQLGYRLLDYRLELFGIPESESDAEVTAVVSTPSPSEPAGEKISSSSESPVGVHLIARSRRGPRH